ncbi:MAG: metallophosphoesterase [Acidobacteria bacterium]|nr:metallophosphoesterase [Acidobacteriota bacterium]
MFKSRTVIPSAILWLVVVGSALASTTRLIQSLTPFQLVEPSGDSYEFIVQGDNRPTGPGKPLPRTIYQVIEEIRLLQPAFVLSVGDIVYGYGDSRQRLLNELDLFQSLAERTGVPFFNAPGNHEIHQNPVAFEILQARYKELYGSFDYAGSHFVVLNTDEIGREGRIEGEQLGWLQADLEANKTARHIFCMMHRPMFAVLNPDFDPKKKQSFASRANRDELHELFRKYPVRIVFSGHEHLYHQETHDGIRYITTAGSGAPLYAQPQDGGFSHYVLVRVNGDKVSLQVIEPFHLEVTYIAGNDGFEPAASARVSNSTDAFVRAQNLVFRLPRVSEKGSYQVSAVLKNRAGEPIDLHAIVRGATDNGDGSANVSVALDMPASSTTYVTVEAHE